MSLLRLGFEESGSNKCSLFNTHDGTLPSAFTRFPWLLATRSSQIAQEAGCVLGAATALLPRCLRQVGNIWRMDPCLDGCINKTGRFADADKGLGNTAELQASSRQGRKQV